MYTMGLIWVNKKIWTTTTTTTKKMIRTLKWSGTWKWIGSLGIVYRMSTWTTLSSLKAKLIQLRQCCNTDREPNTHIHLKMNIDSTLIPQTHTPVMNHEGQKSTGQTNRDSSIFLASYYSICLHCYLWCCVNARIILPSVNLPVMKHPAVDDRGSGI